MCGIVGAVSDRNIVPVLVQGLQRLEYRGYDSCGVAVHAGGLKRARTTSRVADLLAQVRDDHIEGTHRHRPHALGHARRAGGAQRASRTSATAPAPSAKPRGPAASRWCTTASSRTTRRCAPRCRPRATCSPARPTPRSSRT